MPSSRAQLYESAYLADYDFESVMVRFRRKLLLERLNVIRPQVVVEIGCGCELLCEAWYSARRHAWKEDQWVIVESAEQFAEAARTCGVPGLSVVRDVFESAVESVRKLLRRAPDLVICSALLHEVPSSSALLTAVRQVMDDHTRLHVNVPNADSLHRRVAKAMGLIRDTHAMSARNRSLLQRRVYDMRSLKDDLTDASLRIVDQGGYFVKPFTHEQMARIVSILDESVMDGLFRLGREMPGAASEIFVEAVRGHGD